MGPRTSIPEGATVLIAIILSREQPGLLGLITLRGLRLVPPQFRPALHRWRARGPPEDYSGPGAYGSLPPALADPINHEHAEHPEAFDPAAKNVALARAAAEVGTWLFPLLVCVVRAGLRIGEVLALRPEDLDLTTAGHETLRVARARTIDRAGRVVLDDPKTEAGRRTLRLSPAVVTVLRRWLDVDRPAWKLKGGWRTLPLWLFFAAVDPATYAAGDPAAGLLDPGNVRRAIRRLTEALHAEDVAAGLSPEASFPPAWTPHGGRHTVS